MTQDQLDGVLKWLKDLAPNNDERADRIKWYLANFREKRHELQLKGLDVETLVWLLQIIFEVEGKLPSPKVERPKEMQVVISPVQMPMSGIRIPTEANDPDELLDETAWS